jgi:hypothetical protein
MNFTAMKPTSTSSTSSKTTQDMYMDEASEIDSENVEVILIEATEEIQDAEVAQLEVETKKIESMTTKVTNQLRIGIGKLFGNTLSNDEIEDVASLVQTQLKDEAQSSLRSKANDVTKTAIANLEDKVSDEEETGLDEITIEQNVGKSQTKAINSIKYSIDTEVNHVRDTLPQRATEIEKAILEERLSAKLGKRVKLIIDEDNEIASSDDELFNGLNAFNSKQPKKTTMASSMTTSSSSSFGNSGYSQSPPSYGSSYGSSASLPTATSTTSNSFSKTGYSGTFPATEKSKPFLTSAAKVNTTTTTSVTNTTASTSTSGTPTTNTNTDTTKSIYKKKKGKKNGGKN